jgi:hypothetical protein
MWYTYIEVSTIKEIGMLLITEYKIKKKLHGLSPRADRRLSAK